jgi:AraC-like DNA-binding protein
MDLSIKREYVEQEYSVINPLLSDALAYINRNIFTLKSVKEVSDALFVTESYLYRLFKRELKNTPKKYIQDKRLLYAQKLISKGRRPTDVFEDCGFNDYTSFYRGYVKFFGYPPSRDIK